MILSPLRIFLHILMFVIFLAYGILVIVYLSEGAFDWLLPSWFKLPPVLFILVLCAPPISYFLCWKKQMAFYFTQALIWANFATLTFFGLATELIRYFHISVGNFFSLGGQIYMAPHVYFFFLLSLILGLTLYGLRRFDVALLQLPAFSFLIPGAIVFFHGHMDLLICIHGMLFITYTMKLLFEIKKPKATLSQ